MFNKILVADDGSQHSMDAVEAACSLAEHYNATLLLLHVLEDPGTSRVPPELAALGRMEHIQITERDVMQGIGTEIVGKARARAHELGVTGAEIQVATGNPGATIVKTATDQHVDLIVMGRRGLGKVADLIIGSVSQRVMQLADCACLTLK